MRLSDIVGYGPGTRPSRHTQPCNRVAVGARGGPGTDDLRGFVDGPHDLVVAPVCLPKRPG